MGGWKRVVVVDRQSTRLARVDESSPGLRDHARVVPASPRGRGMQSAETRLKLYAPADGDRRGAQTSRRGILLIGEHMNGTSRLSVCDSRLENGPQPIKSAWLSGSYL